MDKIELKNIQFRREYVDEYGNTHVVTEDGHTIFCTQPLEQVIITGKLEL